MTDDLHRDLKRRHAEGSANVAKLAKLLQQLKRKAPELAQRKWASTLADSVQLVREQLARQGEVDVVAAFELSHALSELYIGPVIDELEAELGETAADRAAPLQLLRQIELIAEEGLAVAEALFRSSLDFTQFREESAMHSAESSEPEVNATIIQTIVETLPSREFMADALASLTASNSALVAPAIRPSGVGAQMRRTRDMLGLPTDRDFVTRRDEARIALTEALKRGYAFRDHEGVRSYYRVDHLQTSTRPAASGEGGPSLRGLGLFQVEMLRSQTALLLQLLDELPAILPYTPRLAAYDAEQLRGRVRTSLDDIIAIASAPLGPALGRGEGRFRRLVLAVADWLERGGIASCERLRVVAARPQIKELLGALDLPEHCIVPGAAIKTREIDLRIKALHEALKAIGTIIATPRTADSGRAGAEIEQTMTLLAASAASLRVELDRLGTSLQEQEVVYFGGKPNPEVSIAQFAGWVEDISAPFAASDDEAPTLRYDDFAVLAIDLAELLRLAAALERHAATYAAELRLIGARKQIKEIGYLLRRANEAVATIVADQPTA